MWSSKSLHFVFLACLFGFGVNAFGLHYLFLLMAILPFALGAAHQIGTIPVGLNLVALLLFSATYSLQMFNSIGQVLLNFLYPVAYLVGLAAVRAQGDPNAQFRRLILVVVAGTTLHGVLNALTNMKSYGWVPGDRVLPDFWTQAPLTATLQATLFIPLVGFGCYGLAMRQPRRLIIASFTGLGLITAGVYNLFTASRTIFVVALVTLVACTLVPPGGRLRRIMILAVSAVAIGGLYSLEVLGLRSFVGSSALLERYSSGQAPSLGEDPRFERWAHVVQNFWDHTAGGLHFRAEIGYVHNLWLDAYDVAGLGALLALLGFTIGALALLRRTLVLREVPVELKVLVVGLWVAFLAQFMTEPILDGMPALFAVFCVFGGAVDGLVRGLPLTKASSRPSRIAK